MLSETMQFKKYALEHRQAQDHSLQQEAQLSKVLPFIECQVQRCIPVNSQVEVCLKDAQGNEDLWTHREVFTHK